MRSLFLRIFVSYWLATGLVLAMALSTASWVAWQRLRAMDELEPATLSDGAESALMSGGRDGLLRWTRAENSSIAAPNIYVIDQNNQELLGRSVTTNLLRRAVMEVAALRAGRSWTRGPRYAALLTDASGANYLLIITAAASGPVSALGNLQVLGVLLLIAFTVVGLVCWLVARSVTRPVVRLQASARALAGGNLDARVGPEISKRRDELGQLARDFDLMADKLRQMLASKETLMRDLSHELRSPLARMRVAMGLAHANPVTAANQLARIERESERMDALIGQLLRLSRLMDVERHPELAPGDLSELVTEIVDDGRLEAMAGHKTITWQDPGPVMARVDAEMIRHAIENVLRNALRFTPDGGEITVSLTRDDGWAVLKIQDRGPGVQPDETLKIFEPFYRGLNSEGTGVGLAITARVLALHRGTVVARNRDGGGLEVEFRLRRMG